MYEDYELISTFTDFEVALTVCNAAKNWHRSDCKVRVARR